MHYYYRLLSDSGKLIAASRQNGLLHSVLRYGVLTNKHSSILYGAATFVSALIKNKLIDEFHLFINPAALSKGMTIFTELDSKQKLTLVKATPFDCGIIVLHYEPKRE